MKAYIVSDRNGDKGTCLVVFTETAGKAKAYGAHSEEFCDYGFTGIRANRCRELDRFYKGRSEMDWYDDEDRAAMVQYANFYCSYEYDPADLECEECPGNKWCRRYERRHE